MKNIRAIGAGLGIVLTAALIVGCGGGGGSQTATTTPVVTAGTATMPPLTAQTAALTVSVTIPSKTTASSARRSPSFVSPGTTSITATALPGGAPQSGTCSGGTCTVVLAAPLTTTSIEVQLYGNGYLLSEASEPVTIVAGVNNTPAPLVFSGVTTSLATMITNSQAVIGVPQPLTVTLTPLDATGNHITGPGALIDAAGDLLVSATGSTQTFSLAASGNDTQYLTLSALTWNSSTYVLTATGSYNDGGNGTTGTLTITPSTNVATFQASPLPSPLSIAVNPKSIQIIADPAHTQGNYQILLSALSASTTTSLELGTYPTPIPVSVYLTVVSNFNDAGATLQLNNDYSCENLSFTPTGLQGAFPSPGPTMPSSLSYPFQYNVSGPTPTGNNTSCTFSITDTTNSLTATTNVGLDTTTLTVSSKARK